MKPEDIIIRNIQINCQCIIIQLCYVAANIKKIEQLGALDYIRSFEKTIFKDIQNKQIFVMTVLQYCSENISIRLEGPPMFFVQIIFQQIEEDI